jgi:hypothetical protein
MLQVAQAERETFLAHEALARSQLRHLQLQVQLSQIQLRKVEESLDLANSKVGMMRHFLRQNGFTQQICLTGPVSDEDEGKSAFCNLIYQVTCLYSGQ